MPYLPLDLDAKRLLEAIERGLSLPRHNMVGGAMELWEAVWRQKSALVDCITLWAAFGPDERITPALVSRGFLEPTGDGKFRVCGAEQWLFGMKGKSRGGHAAKGNLIPGAKHKKKAKPETVLPRDSAERTDPPLQILSASAESLPRPPLGTLSALSPSIPASQQASKDFAGKPPEKGKPEKVPDPRHHPLKLRLVAIFAELRSGAGYDFTGRDGKEITALLAKGTDEEIERRWRRGLVGTYERTCHTFGDLASRWNKLATDAPDPPRRAGNARFFAAQDTDQTKLAKVGIAHDF